MKLDFSDSTIKYIVTGDHPLLKRVDLYGRTAIQVLDLLNTLKESGYIVEIEIDDGEW